MARYTLLGVSAALLCFVAAGAHAGTMTLGTSGWQATWATDLDPYVSITLDHETATALYIQKAAQFTLPPGPGGFPTIAIQFQQIAPSTITQIIINDESITNQTGVDWPDFHWELLDGPDAVFNSALTDASGGGAGFYTSPLDNQTWGPGDLSLTVDGYGLGPGGTDAVIPAHPDPGSAWFPGGVLDGELYIDVVSSPGPLYTVFTLKETPTPEPATLGLLLLGGLALLRRRRA